MLTRSERAEVEAALYDLLNQQANPRLYLGLIFGSEATLVTGSMPIFQTPADYAKAALATCLLDGWTHTPSLLETLLLHLEPRGYASVTPLVPRVQAKVDPNPDPCEDFWLTTRRPFFDRTDLRQRLRQLIRDDASPILRIEAPEGSYGRTYTRDFIEHVAHELPGEPRVVGTAISRGTGPTYGAADLALDIVSHLGNTEDPPARTDSSYARAVSRFILSRLMKEPVRSIIVLDGFGQPELNPEVREAIEMLAATIPTGQFRGRIRLVLLDYPQPLPQVSAADILEESLTEARKITDADLRPALIAIGDLRKADGRPELVAADVPVILSQIVNDAPAEGKARLEAFNTALTRVWTFSGSPVP